MGFWCFGMLVLQMLVCLVSMFLVFFQFMMMLIGVMYFDGLCASQFWASRNMIPTYLFFLMSLGSFGPLVLADGGIT